jgi:cytochrome P450
MPDLAPGPRNTVLTTLRYLRDPYGALLQAGRRYGDPFSWPSFLGPMVVTGDPAGARTLFAADPDMFEAIGARLLGPVLGEGNLILIAGERHRAMRKIQSPPFHGSRMHLYGALIARIAEERVGRWQRGSAFAVYPEMQAISLDVILQAVLGLSDARARESFRAAVLSLLAALHPSFLIMPALRRRLLGLSAWARYQRRRAAVDAQFREFLGRRRAEGPGDDILSLFLAARTDDGQPLADDDVLIQIMNLIGAGHETTASSVAWALHHLHRSPPTLERLRDEIASVPADPESVARLPYLEAVCHETLRLTPVAPLVGRELRSELTVQGRVLPAGMSVGIAIINIHRRPDLYPDPERFDPGRFLGRSYGPSEYLPFGGGARRCLGAAFALYEMKLVLATVLRAHRLALVEDRPIRAQLRNTTVAPAGGVPMRVV